MLAIFTILPLEAAVSLLPTLRDGVRKSMPEASSAAPKAGPRKRHSWQRALGWLFGVSIVLLVALYFLFTSSDFLKKHILPRVSKALNANVTAGSVTWKPFSQVVLREVKVQPTNQAPLLTATEVSIKYKLFDVLGGDIRIDEAVLTSPVFQLVQNPDGTSNLDPLRRAAKARQKARAVSKSSKPIQVDIRKVILSDATFRRVQNHKVGTGDLVELTNLDLTLTGMKNNGSGKLQFSSVMRDENNPPAPAMYGLLRAKIDGSFNFTLASNLQPASVLGDAHLQVSQAAGSFSDFAKLEGALHGDVSATEFKSVTLNFEKEGSRIGEVRATGPYNASRAEGRLNVELLSVDKQVLNLLGARYGIDFGSTTMTSTNTLEVGNAGASITAAGQLRASKFQLGRTNESTPPIDLRADYNLSIDKAAKTALVRNLNVAGTQNGRPLLRGELTSPMTLAWGNTTNAVGDSSLNLTLTKLNIAEWKAFAGNLASAGTLDLNMKLLSQEGGARLTFDTTNRFDGLTADIAGQHITDATVLFKARGRATDLKLFDLREYNLQFVQSNQPALVLSGSGTYDRTNSEADLQVTLDASLPRALHLLDYPDVSASSGTAELKGRVMQTHQTQTVSGNLSIAKFTGKLGNREFRNFGATMDLDVERTPGQVNFHKVTGELSGGRNSGGEFELSGFYNLANKPSQLTMTFSNFNQEGLRPLLEPLFANKRLVSVSMNGNSSVQINPKGSSVIQADMQLSNLVVNDLAQQALPAPLEAGVKLDATVRRHIADVRQLEVTLTPTERATNRFQLQGHLDTSRTNYLQGDLELTADSLDLTSYYDLFAATNKPNPKTGSNSRNRTQNPPPPPPGTREPMTNHLPFANFTLAANVKQFYLREIAASNLQGMLKLDGSHVLLKPFQLTMGGSPALATAEVDMSVPGWKYALTVNGTNVPYAPLWNTFNPERKGEVSGSVTAYGNIDGVGISGETLQKSLAGNFHIEATNLNLHVTAIRSRLLLGVIGIVANVADLFNNPLSALSVAANVVRGNVRGRLSDDMNNSPIETITVEGIAGNGRITVQKALVRSSAFEAMTTNGEIMLAPDLTNSTINIPVVHLGVGTAIAGRLSFLRLIHTQTNDAYLSLPDFLSQTGTIGDPRPVPNVVVLTKSTIQEVTNAVVGTNSVLAQPLQGVGDLLKGPASSNGPGTNQPGTNKPATNTLFKRIVRPTTK